MVRIRRALISVFRQTGIVDFARELQALNIEIIVPARTGALYVNGIECARCFDVTGFPEMMGGRVKTLHPRIHGGLLGLRDYPDHQAAMREHEIDPIDMSSLSLSL